MGRKYKPTADLPVLIDHILDGLEVVPFFLQKESRELIEIHPAGIKGLPSTATAQEIIPDPCLREWSWLADWVGESFEFSTWKEPIQRQLVM